MQTPVRHSGPVPGLRAGGDVPRSPLQVTLEGVGRCFLIMLCCGCAKLCLVRDPAVGRGWISGQPWRCLWRGFSQMTMTRPLRRITLHLSQIFLTLG